MSIRGWIYLILSLILLILLIAFVIGYITQGFSDSVKVMGGAFMVVLGLMVLFIIFDAIFEFGQEILK